MKSGKYSIHDLFSNRNLSQIVIPEIQRDYVWEKGNIEGLLNPIIEDFESEIERPDLSSGECLPAKLSESFIRFLESQKTYSNIGFIYAYEDPQYLGKFFLIDGQQRITTLYLLILALAIKEDKKEHFRKKYMYGKLPKLDYKVREASHNFLLNFVEHLLKGKEIATVEDQYWYFSEYNRDTTIKSLISNYNTMIRIVSEFEMDLNYVENNLEFWFFDTNDSAQGEELYLYMNSRGETVQQNENVKALLLQDHSDLEKQKWGVKWEDWQNYFWKKRDKKKRKPSADDGFDNFIRWIKIIERANPDLNISENDQDKSISKDEKFDRTHLSFEKIEDYLNAVKKIFSGGHLEILPETILSGTYSQIYLFRLLPTLHIARHHPGAAAAITYRFARFFYNVSRFGRIDNNPHYYTIRALSLVNRLPKVGKVDVTDFLELKGEEAFATILTREEVFKLSLYKNPPTGTSREDIETAFQEAEDHALLHGRIEVIFDCMGIDFETSSTEDFSLPEFSRYLSAFKNIFENRDDLLRRALLTKGDYLFWHGQTPTLGGVRWSFIYGGDARSWRRLLRDFDRRSMVKALLVEYSAMTAGKAINPKQGLNLIIKNYLKKKRNVLSWRYNFVKHPELLHYCYEKNICYIDATPQGIYLLKATKAMPNSFISVADYLEKLKAKES